MEKFPKWFKMFYELTGLLFHGLFLGKSRVAPGSIRSEKVAQASATKSATKKARKKNQRLKTEAEPITSDSYSTPVKSPGRVLSEV